MIRRRKAWLVAAVLFTLINVAGAVWAAAEGEPVHAAVHVALTLLGTYAAWRLSGRTGPQEATPVPRVNERLELLQQSVDAVAIEVERLGEAQRFNAKLQAERGEERR